MSTQAVLAGEALPSARTAVTSRQVRAGWALTVTSLVRVESSSVSSSGSLTR